MIFPLKFALGLALLALPIIEIALLIKAGAAFGFWPVFFWIIATAVVGSGVIQRSGLSIFPRIWAHIEAGRSGFEPLLDQFLTVTGGVLLILPGLLGDALGALMLVPPVRWLMLRAIASLFTIDTYTRSNNAQTRETWQNDTGEPFDTPKQGKGSDGFRRGRERRTEPPIIEGEYQRIDDDKSGS
ncbi:MAG: FxsA family protein [Hyphomicrobium sp.]